MYVSLFSYFRGWRMRMNNGNIQDIEIHFDYRPAFLYGIHICIHRTAKWMNEPTDATLPYRQENNQYSWGCLYSRLPFCFHNLAKYYICKIKNEYYKLECVCVLRTHEKYYCLGITVPDLMERILWINSTTQLTTLSQFHLIFF